MACQSNFVYSFSNGHLLPLRDMDAYIEKSAWQMEGLPSR